MIKNRLDQIGLEIIKAVDPIDGMRYDALSMLEKFYIHARKTTSFNLSKEDVEETFNEDYESYSN